MIRYELKDKERQAAFEKALPGFDENLQTACEYQYGDGSCCVIMQPEAYKGILISNLIVIDKDAIAAKEVYDPKKWNSYPEVTPPEGVLMRIEGQYAQRPELEYYGALMYLEGAWHFADTVEIADNVIVERFRPWDEESAK